MTWGRLWGERGEICPGASSVEDFAKKRPRICISSMQSICVLLLFQLDQNSFQRSFQNIIVFAKRPISRND